MNQATSKMIIALLLCSLPMVAYASFVGIVIIQTENGPVYHNHEIVTPYNTNVNSPYHYNGSS